MPARRARSACFKPCRRRKVRIVIAGSIATCNGRSRICRKLPGSLVNHGDPVHPLRGRRIAGASHRPVRRARIGRRFVLERRDLPSPTRDVRRLASLRLPCLWSPDRRERQHSRRVLASLQGPMSALSSTDLGDLSLGRISLRRTLGGHRGAFWLRLGAARLFGASRGTAGTHSGRYRTHAAAEEDRLSVDGAGGGPPRYGEAATGKWHEFAVGAACAAGWFVVFLCHEPGQSTAFGLRGRPPVTGPGPRSGWLGVGYVLLGFFAANLIGAVIGIALIAD